ncbi:MAG TPA: helix-turn-helix transcriptional regulator [Dehalococcoidales bacterium]|nr:MAG: hypothetical protein A2Z05_06070 [Chloroflexi bacterium RBG_16_60_22]HJX12333.1 helix-turn-helix transcriptional regulator [Dehalococcoidales bacterium]
MEKSEFRRIRRYLGQSQGQLARLICVSPKSIQSFEQGWRGISASAERQLLFLLSLKRSGRDDGRTCWEIKGCPEDWRQDCTAWEFNAGRFCWFINGTRCQGQVQPGWKEKISICRKCAVFRQMLALA